MKCQKELFDIEEDVSYLNGALMSPLLKSSVEAGIEGMKKKMRPYSLTEGDFFEPGDIIRKEFADIINCKEPERIAILPSVSYGMSILSKNIKLDQRKSILVVGEEFPSNYYPWKKATDEQGGILTVIKAPSVLENRGELWNQQILAAIDENTKAVCIGNIHWTCGTIFNLKEIRKRTKEAGALLIIDASQTIGAFPFSLQEVEADAIIVAGWKWLLGPYSIALGYFGPAFDNSETIEENWINKKNSNQFDKLLYYQDQYIPSAQRHNVGEFSNFTLLPMMINGIRTAKKWDALQIQEYCADLIRPFVPEFQKLGCWIEHENYRTSHVFGILLPDGTSIEALKQELSKNKVYISVRGNFLRISPNVYNDENDIEKLLISVRNVIEHITTFNNEKINYGLH
ncbi:aminotransferase class V-fold PLP-dependent enzyme [Anaeromicropila populeti]|uniref:Selenocysteine lyase/Cysteine desulfurase n=1 Tax=Anaeromicropila populeti TaxID=37658 RepID=A0A1I6L0G3_9FIRM|nr:aminotransferase class V-fold PLP-dependent enzyme [Anaeromicropila populeti]SFR96963.1 Selenocysteine lyase/Cysteine desulfurase [Anaeromicropila populeti]